MNSKPLTINGITVQTTNACTVHQRQPDAADMIRCWDRDRILKHLDGLPGDEREALRAELNRVKGEG